MVNPLLPVQQQYLHGQPAVASATAISARPTRCCLFNSNVYSTWPTRCCQCSSNIYMANLQMPFQQQNFHGQPAAASAAVISTWPTRYCQCNSKTFMVKFLLPVQQQYFHGQPVAATATAIPSRQTRCCKSNNNICTLNLKSAETCPSGCPQPPLSQQRILLTALYIASACHCCCGSTVNSSSPA